MKRGRLGWLLLAGLVVFAAGGAGVFLLSDLEKRVQLLSDGIEWAEGFGVAGARPTVANNPGALTVDITGTGIGFDSGGLVMYASYADGREALETQVRWMLTGQSSRFNPGMTIAQVAATYTDNASAWARNVAAFIGVSPDTVISQIPV